MLTVEKIRKAVIPSAIKYNVTKIDLFGSYALGVATEQSDVDFLVEFGSLVPSIFTVMGFKEEISAALGVDVDVVVFPLVRPEVLNIREVENIYERA